MNTIHTLPKHEAQKIAAGEVIERPANSIKELLENSLDAYATTITLSVKKGGKEQISIIDNGEGMSLEDAKICFKRHTTSKITAVEDLDTIATFGFRGEALASICSIAKVTIITKKKEATEGIKLYLEAGVLKKETVTRCQTGTTIIIDDLFYNVPVRKNFLKTTATEWNTIATLFKAFVLSHHSIHFILEHNNKTVYNCPPSKGTVERSLQVFEAPLINNIIALDSFNTPSVSFSGAITTQHYARYDRGGIFFFVNNRWVKNFKLTNALLKGYLNVLPTGRYPAAIINISIDQKTVDINIHPKKEEIKFMNQRHVETTLTAAIKNTLENHLSEQLKKHVQIAQPTPIVPDHPFKETPPPFPAGEQFNSFAPSSTTQSINPIVQEQKISEPSLNELIPVKQETIPEHYSLIGQFKKTYLLLEHKDGLFIIDQHAAHERILYEKFADTFKDVPVVPLLFPLIVTLSEEDIQTLAPYLYLFKEHGIEIEQFGHNQCAIKATPVFLKNQPISDLIEQTISWIKELHTIEKEDFFKKITERMRAQMSCKAAVRAGDTLSQETMQQLLLDLEKTSNRFSCPHGRPTGWLLTLSEIEKKFKRDYK